MARIALVSLDVDGVLTDGRLYFSESGEEIKTFSSRDGHALRMLQDSGVDVAIITGRRTRLVSRRARELRIRHVYQGVADKRQALARLLDQTGLPAERVAHIGDDIPDLPVLARVGVAVGVADATPVVREHVHLLTQAAGGCGAVRELCELVMRAHHSWHAAIARHL